MSETKGYTDQQALNKIATEGVRLVSRSVGDVTFTGAGVNDMENGGVFTGNDDIVYEVEIDATGTPDTFKWSKGIVGESLEEQATGVSITGLDQALDNGITVNFATTTGHTLGDKWTFTAFNADPTAVHKTPINLNMPSLAPSGSVTFGPFDLRNVEAVALTIGLIFNGGASAGVTVLALTSPDNVNYDTDDDAYASIGLEPDFVAGATVQKTSIIDTLPIKFLKIKVTNDEAGFGTSGKPSFITQVER